MGRLIELRRLAVTGPPGAGKSLACQFLAELGAYVVDADAIAHTLLLPESELGRAVIQLLGEEVIEKKEFSRKKIAEKVFANSSTLFQLEALIHPAVQDVIQTHYQKAQDSHAPCFAAEIPLLYECSWEKEYDAVLLIDAADDQCKKRHALADDELSKRQERLWPIEKKRQRADFIITNNHSKEEFKKKVEFVYEQFSSREGTDGRRN